MNTPVTCRLRRTSLLALITALLSGPGFALSPDGATTTEPQTLVMVDDFPVTDVHFAVFASQTGRNPADAAGQLSLLNELVNHFMVANSPEGQALAENPDVVAALEVARARLLAQTFVRAQLVESPITDEELQAAYAERYADTDGLEYKARHILVETEDEARALIAELDEGADFAELAKQHSTGPSGASGGDLGWFEPAQMVEPFAKATAALSDGAYTREPVETTFGWHVILREQSRKQPVPELEDVRDSLTRELQQQRIGEAISRIRDNTQIEVQTQ
jgi:peptidyl-prolyl cis-trans isomerase C